MEIHKLVLGVVRTNCYIVSNERTKEAVIIDPSDEGEEIIKKMNHLNLTPVAVLLTHGHFDHIMAIPELLKTFQIPVYVCEEEAELMEDPSKNGAFLIRSKFTLKTEHFIRDEQELTLAGIPVKVIHTPGHTAGGLCYYIPEEGVLFSGDTLFLESIGRTDLATGNLAALIQSVKEKLMKLPESVKVYPGHGDSTTIGYEKNHNPYISDENFWNE